MRSRNVFLLLTIFVVVDARLAAGQEATQPAVLPVLGELQDEVSVSIAIDESGGTMEDSAETCLLYTSPSPRDATLSRMPSSA